MEDIKKFKGKEKTPSIENQIIKGLKAKGIDDPKASSLLSEWAEGEKNTLHPDDFKAQYRYSLEKKKADIYLKAGYPEKALEILSSAILRAEEKKDTELGLGIIEEIKQSVAKVEAELKKEKERLEEEKRKEEDRKREYGDRSEKEVREKVESMIRRIHDGVMLEKEKWGKKEWDLIEEMIRNELNYKGDIGHLSIVDDEKEERGVYMKYPMLDDLDNARISVEFEK